MYVWMRRASAGYHDWRATVTESQRHILSKSANRPLVFIGVVIAAMTALVLASKLRQAADLIPWRTDLFAAQSEAGKTGKPLFLYFGAEWCPPCQDMKRTTWSDKRVESALGQFVPVKIDVDAQPKVAVKYQIQPLPTFVIADKDGNEIRRIDGGMSADDLIAWINAR